MLLLEFLKYICLFLVGNHALVELRLELADLCVVILLKHLYFFLAVKGELINCGLEVLDFLGVVFVCLLIIVCLLDRCQLFLDLCVGLVLLLDDLFESVVYAVVSMTKVRDLFFQLVDVGHCTCDIFTEGVVSY